MSRYGDEFYGLAPYGTDTLVDFDVSPFSVSSIDYNKIFVEWNQPTGDWDRIRLVRNGFGFPMTPDDGDLLFEGDNTTNVRTYLDEGQVPANSGLIEGRTYYYTVFVRNTTTGRWIAAGTNLGVAVKNFGTAELMYEYLPAVYKIGNPFTAEDNDTDLNNDLFSFLQIFAFEHDLFKTLATNMKNRYDPLTLDGRLIPLALNEFGFPFEKEIGIQQARSLLKNAIKIYSERGSLSGIKAFVTAFSGFNVDVSGPINLMLDYNNATFIEAIGFWENIENTTLVRTIQANESPAVPPYIEPSSPPNFPNAAIGFLKATAVASADMLFACGYSAPMTRGIPVNAGTRYNLTCYSRAKTTARPVTLNIQWYDRFGQLIGTAGEATSTNVVETWTRTVECSGVAPENAYFALPQVRVEETVAGEVHYFDAFQFAVGTEAVTFAEARRIDLTLRANRINQVLNPSFEESLANWAFESTDPMYTVTVERVLDGAIEGSDYSAKITAGMDNQEISVPSQFRVPVTGADQNSLSAYVKGTAGTTARLVITWYDQSDIGLSFSATDPVTLDLDGWTRLEVAALAPEAAVTAAISVDFLTQSTGDVVYLDAILFEKAAFVAPYFDGSAGYAQLGDTLWENGDPVSGRSHYYKNREVVIKRLFDTLPDYVPAGAPWAVFVAEAD